MSNSLKTIFLVIGLHWNVKEVYHYRNLDMKSVKSLDDVKNQEK